MSGVAGAESEASTGPGESAGRPRRGRVVMLGALAVVVAAVATTIVVVGHRGGGKVSRADAGAMVTGYVNEAIRATGQTPEKAVGGADFGVNACDNGAGGDGGYSASSEAWIDDVGDDKARQMAQSLAEYLRGHGFSQVTVTDNVQNIGAGGVKGDGGVTMVYDPRDGRHRVRIGADTHCDVQP